MGSGLTLPFDRKMEGSLKEDFSVNMKDSMVNFVSVDILYPIRRESEIIQDDECQVRRTKNQELRAKNRKIGGSNGVVMARDRRDSEFSLSFSFCEGFFYTVNETTLALY